MPFLDIPVPVRWSDLDGYGHVNNTAYLRLLEEARTRAFWQPSDTELANGAPAYPTALAELSPGGAFHTLVAAHTIEYSRQLGYRRDGVLVRTWVSKLGGASLDLDYTILTADEPDQPYASARTTIVIVDAKSGKAVRMPERLRTALERVTGAPLTFRRA
ncbi:acyl-CoA thioesterase [Dermabacter vaginalis]|uniref:acyl-CoA thioesterase n=1 Tax=Dermabacter vaginalis TaxID=1630135 RepID=UPI0021A8EE90|nr:thioesterase family protein [Dermabacter vaginalis]MCT2149083.1 acyl-CoA thioesterase [Dermabacter vaginalis]